MGGKGGQSSGISPLMMMANMMYPDANNQANQLPSGQQPQRQYQPDNVNPNGANANGPSTPAGPYGHNNENQPYTSPEQSWSFMGQLANPGKWGNMLDDSMDDAYETKNIGKGYDPSRAHKQDNQSLLSDDNDNDNDDGDDGGLGSGAGGATGGDKDGGRY